MAPTQLQQFQHLHAKLDAIEGGQKEMIAKLDAALLQQARHDEQIKVIQRGGGGALTFIVGILAALAKDRLGL